LTAVHIVSVIAHDCVQCLARTVQLLTASQLTSPRANLEQPTICSCAGHMDSATQLRAVIETASRLRAVTRMECIDAHHELV